MPKIVVAGSLNMDLVALAPRIPGVGETLTGTGYFTNPGGKGANQAYAAAMLGGDVGMIGKIGADDFGASLSASLSDAGCDTTWVSSTDAHTGIAVITVSDAGKNSIVVVPGANGQFGVADIENADAALASAEILLLQLESPLATVQAAATRAKAHGALVILDPAPAPRTPLSADLLAQVDILTPNEVEAAQLSGRPSTALTEADAIAAARHLLTHVPHVILKLGERGCLLAGRDAETWIPAPLVRAVDSTAAGDCFNGALAVALAEGRDLVEACRFAVSAAALSVTRMGAQASMPSRAELADFLALDGLSPNATGGTVGGA